MMVDQDQYFGIFKFLILKNSKFDPSLKQIWSFLTFDSVITCRMKTSPWTFLHYWHWHTDRVSCIVEGFLNLDFGKNLWPRSNHLTFFKINRIVKTQRRFMFIEQWPKMTTRWHLSSNPWTPGPLLSLTWWSIIHPSFTKFYQDIIDKNHFWLWTNRFLMFTKIIIFKTCNFLDQLPQPYKFHGSSIRGILFFNCASCEPLKRVCSLLISNL